MLRYYITDRRGLGGVDELAANIGRLIGEGAVDWIQIREKDLSARDLLLLTRRVVALKTPDGPRVFVNSRLDVAIAAGADGVHLPSHSPGPDAFKQIAPQMLFGVSCHNREELEAAEREGADYAVLGPVYAPLSKAVEDPPMGLERFGELPQRVRIPVLALGGITDARIPYCERAGAAGVAGISLFQGLARR